LDISVFDYTLLDETVALPPPSQPIDEQWKVRGCVLMLNVYIYVSVHRSADLEALKVTGAYSVKSEYTQLVRLLSTLAPEFR